MGRPPRDAHWALIDDQYYLVAGNGRVIDVVGAAPPPPPPRYSYAPPPPPPGPNADDRWRARYRSGCTGSRGCGGGT